MRLLSRDEFLKEPPGTVYMNFEPAILGPLMVKGEDCGLDWYENNLGPFVDMNDGTFELSNSICREGNFDDSLKYLVLDYFDKKILIDKLRGTTDVPTVVLPCEDLQ